MIFRGVFGGARSAPKFLDLGKTKKYTATETRSDTMQNIKEHFLDIAGGHRSMRSNRETAERPLDSTRWCENDIGVSI